MLELVGLLLGVAAGVAQRFDSIKGGMETEAMFNCTHQGVPYVKGLTIDGKKIWVEALKETFLVPYIASAASKAYTKVCDLGKKVGSFFGLYKIEEESIEVIEATPLLLEAVSAFSSAIKIVDKVETEEVAAKDLPTSDKVEISTSVSSNAEVATISEEVEEVVLKKQDEAPAEEDSDEGVTILKEGETSKVEASKQDKTTEVDDDGFEEDPELLLSEDGNHAEITERSKGTSSDSTSAIYSKKKIEDLTASMSNEIITDRQVLGGDSQVVGVEVSPAA